MDRDQGVAIIKLLQRIASSLEDINTTLKENKKKKEDEVN